MEDIDIGAIAAGLLIGGAAAGSSILGGISASNAQAAQQEAQRRKQMFEDFTNKQQVDKNNRQKLQQLQNQYLNNAKIYDGAVSERASTQFNVRKQMEAARAKLGAQSGQAQSSLQSNLLGRGMRGGTADRLVALQAEQQAAQRLQLRQKESAAMGNAETVFRNRIGQRSQVTLEQDIFIGGPVPQIDNSGQMAGIVAGGLLSGVASGAGAYFGYKS